MVWSGPLTESVISESDGLSVYYARLITSTSYLRLTTFLVEALLNRTAQMLRRRAVLALTSPFLAFLAAGAHTRRMRSAADPLDIPDADTQQPRS